MYNDPSGGVLFVCRNCRTCLDSIQLYSKTRKISLEEGILELKSRTSLPSDTTKKWFSAWKEEVSEPQRKLITLLEKSSLYDLTTEEKATLSILDVYAEGDYKAIGRCYPKGLYSVDLKAFNEAIKPWKPIKIKTKQSKFLCVSYCDVFNRPRQIEFFDKKGKSYIWESPIKDEAIGQSSWEDPQKSDKGLALLSSLPSDCTCVYAVDSVQLALQLRSMNGYISTRPINIVAYSDDTGYTAWHNTKAKKIVFWSPQITYKLFAQALKTNNAFVSFSPKIEENVTEGIRKLSFMGWRQAIEKSQVPVEEALVKWLLSLEINEAEQAIDKLGLTYTFCESLVNKQEEYKTKVQLNNLFKIVDGSKTVFVDGKEVCQAGGNWSEVYKAGPQQITDFILHFDRIQVPTSGTKPHIIGHVEKNKKVFPFREVLETLELDTAGWLTKFLLEQKEAIPVISPRWRKKLFVLAQTFHNPEVVSCIDKVGYTEEHGFIFNNFTFKNNEIIENVEKNYDIIGSYIPCQFLPPPKIPALVPAAFMIPTKNAVVVWSLIFSVLLNFEAQKRGAETKGIIIECPEGNDASTQASIAFARALNAPLVSYESGMDLSIIDRGHSIPVFINARKNNLNRQTFLNYLYDPTEKSCAVLAKDINLWKSLGLSGWIHIPPICGQGTEFPFEAIPEVLFTAAAHLDKVVTNETVPSVMEVVNEVLINLPLIESPRLDHVKMLIDHVIENIRGDRYWLTNRTDRILVPVVKTIKEAEKTKNVEIKKNVVYIQLAFVRNQVQKLYGIELDLEDIKTTLRSAGLLRSVESTIIGVPENYWHELYEKVEILNVKEY